jgi:hypothetical protein
MSQFKFLLKAVAVFCLWNSLAFAQAPDSLWSHCFGGAGTEVAGTNSPNNNGNNMASAAFDAIDGTSYLATYSSSASVYGRTNAGSDDILLIHLDQNGDTLWTKLLGGSGIDRVYRIRAVSTGGIIMAGSSDSNNGTFSGAGNHGSNDGYLMRINSAGQILWVKQYGGSSIDFLYDIAENPAGNFVAAGESASSDGDLSGAGNGLAWVVFVNGQNGTLSNSVAPNGPNSSNPNGLENFTIIKRLADGTGYLLGGFTSPDFSNFNLDDIWVCKMNFAGTVIWNKTYGSNNARDGAGAILDMGNGEFMITGMLGGNGGYPAYRGGNGDGFVLRCNANGDTLWTKTYGGTDWDFFHDAIMDNDTNIYLAGFSRSNNQQLASQPAFGLADYWVLKVNQNGDTLYTKRMGGSAFDAATGIACSGLADDLLICGRTESNDSWVNGNNGGRDLWAVRLNNISTGISLENKNQTLLFPNPAADKVYLQFSDLSQKRIQIKDLSGRILLSLNPGSQGSIGIELPPDWARGLYFVDIQSKTNYESLLFIKQ